jgi:glycosyltransferase involved in cell wall biosynthesis
MKSKKSRSLFYIFHGRFPSEKAASIFAAKSCEALGDVGERVILLVPRRFGRINKDPYEYFGVKNNFKIVYLPTIDLFPLPIPKSIAFRVSFVVFSIAVLVYLLARAKKTDIVYSNESLALFISSFIFPNTLYEVHDFPEKKFWYYNKLFKRLKWILVTNIWKEKELIKRFGIDKKRMCCEPNGVNIDEFTLSLSQRQAREKIGVPVDKHIVVYTGHLYSWKGADILADAAPYLPEDFTIYFVGGTETDIAKFKKKYSNSENVIFVGHRLHSEMPYWQCAADVLAVPNTAKEDISKYYTSPMKICEYMASNRPIVATRIPSITEILNESNALLVEPDDPQKLANAILKLINDTDLQGRLSSQAFCDVAVYTWDKRAKRILSFLKENAEK